MFPMIFQSSMGLGKLRCDILNGPPKDAFALYEKIHAIKGYFLVCYKATKHFLKIHYNIKHLEYVFYISSHNQFNHPIYI
jgi:hypothetical protein